MGKAQQSGECTRLRLGVMVMLMLSNICVALAEPKTDPLLSFSGAEDGQVVIEAGAEHLLNIRYEPGLDWSRFKATVNGKDVTPYFNPKPRSAEPITVPFILGDNLFEFEVGRMPGKDRRKDSGLELEHYELMVRVVKPDTSIGVMGKKIVATPQSK